MSAVPAHTSSAAASRSTRPPPRSWLRPLLRQRSVRIALTGWVAANVWVTAAGGNALPFEWPALAERSVLGQLVDVNLAMLQVFLLMGVTVALTRRRTRPVLVDRAPERSIARRETVLLVAYGVLGLAGGFLLARSIGWHPFGLHLAGTLYGTHEHVGPAEAVAWASYNVLVYAVLPLLFFRRRYSAEELNLRSADRRGDAVLIAVVLVIETVFQLLV